MKTATQFQHAKQFPGPKGYAIVGGLPKIRGHLIEFITGMWLGGLAL